MEVVRPRNLLAKVLMLGRDLLWFSTLTDDDVREMVEHFALSDYLPYSTYDPDKRVYYNTDDTVGFIWQCYPLVAAGKNTIENLNSVANVGIPDGSVLQFILYADPYVDPYLKAFADLKVRKDYDPLVARAVDRYVEFLEKGKYGLERHNNIPVRDFKLFIAFKMPVSLVKNVNLTDLRSGIEEVLKGIGLFPQPLPPEELIFWLYRLFNGRAPEGARSWDRLRPINRQIIATETVIEKLDRGVKIGNSVWRCLTPKKIPPEVDTYMANLLTGGVGGVVDDINQIRTPFLISLNMYFTNLETMIRLKTSIMAKQKLIASVAEDMKNRFDEFIWACGELDKGERFVRAVWTVWVMGRDEEEARNSLMRVKNIWEHRKFVMDEERRLSLPLFIASLPFGLYKPSSTLKNVPRDHIAPTKSAFTLAPIQADFAGGGSPVLLFLGRKGQLITLDFFDKRANNMNAIICATSGAGKSFLTNYIAFNYYGSGAKIRIIDIGGSYRKLCRMLGGKFIEFTRDSNIVLNPFALMGDITDPEDFQPYMQSIVSILAQMCSATTKEPLGELEYNLLQKAALWSFQQYGPEACVDTVYGYLSTYPEHDSEFSRLFGTGQKSQERGKRVIDAARLLAYNLSRFSSTGIYGRWFNGRGTLRIAEDEFVVLELEELKKQTDLFNVVTLAVLDAVTASLYLSDRKTPQLIIFDEAWQFFDDTSHLKHIIEEGYRRARKYGGSFTTITQGITDMEKFGAVGQVLMNNSAFKFYLEGQDFEAAKKKGIIDYDDWIMRMLATVKSNHPKYSEIFMDTPFGKGVARLCVDDYTYYIYTSNAREVAEIEELVKQGYSYDEAIEEMVRRYRNGKESA